MTEADKDILIARMFDAPASLTEREMDVIENDEELRQIYETASEVRSAVLMKQEFDLDEEWGRFRPVFGRKGFSRPFSHRRLFRYAAVFAGLIAIAACLIRFKDKLSTSDDTRSTAETSVTKNVQDSPLSPFFTAQEAGPAKSGVCDLAEKIDVRHAKTHRSNTSSSLENSKSVCRVNAEEGDPVPTSSEHMSNSSADTFEEMDLDEYLRIQQTRIDNDLALQYAEVVREEVKYLRSVHAIPQNDEDFPFIMSEIHKVTLE